MSFEKDIWFSSNRTSGVKDFQLDLTRAQRRLESTLESFPVAFEMCKRCTRFSTGFDIGLKEVTRHSRIFSL